MTEPSLRWPTPARRARRAPACIAAAVGASEAACRSPGLRRGASAWRSCASRAANARSAGRSASPTAASGTATACTRRSGARCGTARRSCSMAPTATRLARRPVASRGSSPRSCSASRARRAPACRWPNLQGCLAWVAHGFEIVHTHFADWRFTLPTRWPTSRCMAACCVGPRVAVQDWPTLADDLAALQVELLCDGVVQGPRRRQRRARRPAAGAQAMDRCDGRARRRAGASLPASSSPPAPSPTPGRCSPASTGKRGCPTAAWRALSLHTEA